MGADCPPGAGEGGTMFKQVLAAVASASLVAMVLLVAPVKAAGVTMTNFTVAAGGEHTCAIDTSGAAWCWGNNSHGQLGEGTDNPANEPQLVTGGHRFASITAGDFHTCALDTSGAAWCWGANEWFYESIPAGQLGDGTLDDANTPQPVTGRHRFTMISAGAYHTCALDTSGVAWCWGANFYPNFFFIAGLLGDGTLGNNANTPQRVDGGGWDGTFVSISAGGFHTCALTSAGAAYCWGYNGFGALGNDTTTSSLTNGPQLVDHGSSSGTFVSVDAGDLYTCALTSAGAAYCWGINQDGRLGDGSTSDRRDVPAAVIGGYVWAMIDAGDDHTCGVTTTGYGYCWGDNINGELGEGSDNPANEPQPIMSGEQFSVVIPNGFQEGNHSCGLTPDGTLYCWGANGDGQLGGGGNSNQNIPTLVIGGHEWMLRAGFSNCGTLEATVCPTIIDAGSGNLIGAPGSAAMSTPARYTWLSCRVAGGGTTSRPSDCRPGKSVTSTGARFSRMAYRISLADRRSGYLRLAVQVRGTTYYSGTFDVRP
jgi:alpha-tubulin suppressor-like RCC1 family protein